jgi:hypothetical protein
LAPLVRNDPAKRGIHPPVLGTDEAAVRLGMLEGPGVIILPEPGHLSWPLREHNGT